MFFYIILCLHNKGVFCFGKTNLFAGLFLHLQNTQMFSCQLKVHKKILNMQQTMDFFVAFFLSLWCFFCIHGIFFRQFMTCFFHRPPFIFAPIKEKIIVNMICYGKKKKKYHHNTDTSFKKNGTQTPGKKNANFFFPLF